MINYVSLLIMVLLTSTGQLLVKQGAVTIHYNKGLRCFIKTFFNKYIILGVSGVLLAPVFYIYALINIKLSVAYSFTALIYIFVFLGSWLILKERTNLYHFWGVLFIFLGVLIFNN